MASELKGNSSARKVHRVSDYGQRAAAALNDLLPGQHRDKLVARMFSVSLRTAKYLRAGQHWTTDRLSQASAVLGTAFDAALLPASDARRSTELYDIAERLARLENWRAEMGIGDASGLPPAPGGKAFRQGREDMPAIGLDASGRALDRDGEAPPDEGTPLAQALQRREVKR